MQQHHTLIPASLQPEDDGFKAADHSRPAVSLAHTNPTASWAARSTFR